MRKLWSVLLIFSFLIPSVLGMGLGSYSKKFHIDTDFVPNGHYKFSYFIITNCGFTNDYEFQLEGDIAQYVKFDPPVTKDLMMMEVPTNTIRGFSGTIEFPETLEPGRHGTKLCVIEKRASGGSVGGKTGSCLHIRVRSLYPTKYPVLRSFGASNANENSTVDLTAIMDNWGMMDVERAEGTVTVFDLNNESVGTAFFDPAPIKAAKHVSLLAEFDTTGVKPGSYWAYADITADGFKFNSSYPFKIGTMKVKVTNYSTTLEKGGIKKYPITISNEWNDPISGVSAHVKIFDKETDEVLVAADTASYDLIPWQKEGLTAYIDTSDLDYIEYKLEIGLSFAGFSEYTEDTLTIIRPPSEEKPSVLTPTIMLTIAGIILVLALTLLNIILFMHKKGKK